MRHLIGAFVMITALFAAGPAAAGGDLQWLRWTPDIFQRAQAEKRLVILDLEAVWCHWCHVMEEKTYGDPKIAALLKSHFLAVRADQDANPDLSSRYGDWGWPATIIFASDGTELAKLTGYIPPESFITFLKAFIANPKPGPSAIGQREVRRAPSIFLSTAQREHLLGNYDAVYDDENGGWGKRHKFIHADSMEYALKQAAAGDAGAARRARQTLQAARLLFDREWGGVYQYSDAADWRSPHYEKIMWYQAQYLRHYAFAYGLWKDREHLAAAEDIYRYLTTLLLSPQGAFYTSQDADAGKAIDGKRFYALNAAERRRLGAMPRIDTNVYARENGWAISGLAALYNVTGRRDILDHALASAEWILVHRRLAAGGFKHGDADGRGPFLDDSLAMGQAALDLYFATGERKWLKVAAEAGFFILTTFKAEAGGFWTAAESEADAFEAPVRQIEENIRLARYANLLHRTHGAPDFRDMATHTMRYLASPDLTGMRRFLIGVVLADDELSIEPAHITVVGRKDDANAQALHAAARAYSALYKRLDWWDTREGPLPNPDVTYPEMDRAAAFACANQICSFPVFDPKELEAIIKRMMAARTSRRPVGRAQ